MPRDNEAPGGIRSLHRVELAAKLAVRDASATKGGMLSNFYEERTPTITRIVKRPGVEPAGVVGSGCGGQGFTEFNGSLLTVACDTLYQQHMVGLHAIVTTSKYTPAEETGSNRYKLKFRPDQCGGEHVWNDPCDEDRESGVVTSASVAGYTLIGIDDATQRPFFYNIGSGTYALQGSAITGALSVASGPSTFGVVDVTGNLKIYNKSWSLLTTVATGVSTTDVAYLDPHYYVMSYTTIKKYTEAGASAGSVAVTQTGASITTDNTGAIYTIGANAVSKDWYDIDKWNTSLVSGGTLDRDSGEPNSAFDTTAFIAADTSNIYAAFQFEDPTLVNRPYLVRINTSMVEQTVKDMSTFIPGNGYPGDWKVAVTPDRVWVLVNLPAPISGARVFGLNLTTLALEVTYSHPSFDTVGAWRRDYYA